MFVLLVACVSMHTGDGRSRRWVLLSLLGRGALNFGLALGLGRAEGRLGILRV